MFFFKYLADAIEYTWHPKTFISWKALGNLRSIFGNQGDIIQNSWRVEIDIGTGVTWDFLIRQIDAGFAIRNPYRGFRGLNPIRNPRIEAHGFHGLGRWTNHDDMSVSDRVFRPVLHEIVTGLKIVTVVFKSQHIWLHYSAKMAHIV